MISRSNLVATLLSLSFATAAVAAPQTNATGMKGMSDMSRMTHNEPCIVFYVQQAVTLGATEAELGEALVVASTMGACVGEMWALKAYKA